MPSASAPLCSRKAGARRDAGDLVHEQHEENVGAAQKVDRQDARCAGGVRGGGRGALTGTSRCARRVTGRASIQCPSPSRRRNGSQGLPGDTRCGTAASAVRAEDAGAPATGSSRRYAPAAVPGMPGPWPGRVVSLRSPRCLDEAGGGRRRGRGARDDGPRHAGAHRRGDDSRRVAPLLRAVRRGRHQGERGRRAPRRLDPRHRGRDLPPAHGGRRPALADRRLRALPEPARRDRLPGAPAGGGRGLRGRGRQPAHGEPRLRPGDLRGGGLLRRGGHALEHDAPRLAAAHQDRQHPEHEGPRRGRGHGLPEERRLRLLLERGPQPLPRPDPHPHLGRHLRRGRAAALALRPPDHGRDPRGLARGALREDDALRVPPPPDPVRDGPGGHRPAAPRRHRRQEEGRGRHLDLGPLAEAPEVQQRGRPGRRPQREHPDPRAGPRGVRLAPRPRASPTSRRSAWRRSRCDEGDGPPRGRPARERFAPRGGGGPRLADRPLAVPRLRPGRGRRPVAHPSRTASCAARSACLRTRLRSRSTT